MTFGSYFDRRESPNFEGEWCLNNNEGAWFLFITYDYVIYIFYKELLLSNLYIAYTNFICDRVD